MNTRIIVSKSNTIYGTSDLLILYYELDINNEKSSMQLYHIL